VPDKPYGDKSRVYTGKNLQSDRPVVRRRSNLRLLRPRRRWDQVSWWYSLVFVLPVLLIAGDALFGLGPDGNSHPRVTIHVTDAATGVGVPGAAVLLGGEIRSTDAAGKVTFSRPSSDSLVQVVADGFKPVYGSFGAANDNTQAIALRPVAVAAASENSQPDSNPPAQAQPTELPGATSTTAPTSTTPVGQPESGVVASGTAGSYTHLTLPTKLEV
jgi:hypothetical protein